MTALRVTAASALVFTALVSSGQAQQRPDATAAPQARAVSAQPAGTASKTAAATSPKSRTATQSGAALPKVLVHKSPTCGCCSVWVEHMRKHGFTVEVNNTHALEPIKKRLGVPLGKGSCHTAEVGRYVVEGHVPAQDIKRLIARNDKSRGLVLPGMPAGSPGMEMPDGSVQRYTVERIDAQGATHAFATHGE